MPTKASDIYGQALDKQSSLMSAATSGYAQTIATLQQQGSAVTQGYNKLSGSVLGELTNLGRTAAGDIADQYTQASGRAAQNLTNRGLGNTTVANSIDRGLGYDKARADVALSESVGNQRANYMSQIGMAGLNYQGNLASQVAGLGAQRANTYSQFSQPYASLYSGLANQQFAEEQLPFDRNMDMMRLYAGLGVSNAQMSQKSAASNDANRLANRQLGYKYDALAASSAPGGMQAQANAYGQAMQQRVNDTTESRDNRSASRSSSQR